MDKLFQEVRAHLQELDASQKMTIKELDLVKQSIQDSNTATQALLGTFASIEQVLRNLESREADLEASRRELRR